MAEMNIGKTEISNYSGAVEDYTIAGKNLDGVSDLDETEYINSKWNNQYGLFLENAEVNNAIKMKGVWDVGKGWKADSMTTIILDRIFGWGKDTFTDILFNMDVISNIGGDAFAEIVRNENKMLINLKCLNPASIKIIVGRDGIIKRYEQISRLPENKIVKKIFQPHEIFHICRNRIGDQIHGLSIVDAIEEIAKADKERFKDMVKVMHRQARPLILWKLKTDNVGKIQEFVRKIENARNLGEDTFIPDDEDIVKHELVEIDVSALVTEWGLEIKNKFYRAVGLPQIVFGASGTESGSKVEYLAHEQIFEREQRFFEKQVETQLGLKINLNSPVTLLENLQQDENKDAQSALMFQKNDVTAGKGRDNE